jgi:myo-inositol-1(or 4)-monophosphatase
MFTRIWDIAAPYLIIKEAGGFMTNLEGDDFPFLLNAHAVEFNYAISAGSMSLKNSVMEIIR